MIVRNFEFINHLVIHLLVKPNKNILADQILLFNYSFGDCAFTLRTISAHRLMLIYDCDKFGLLLGLEDTRYVTIEHRLANLLFLLFSPFFCPFVSYYFTPSGSQNLCWRAMQKVLNDK